MTIRDDEGLISGSDPAGTIGPMAKKRRSKGVRVTYAAAVALGLAVGSGAIAGAATGGSTATTTPTAPTIPGGLGWRSSFGGNPPAAMGEVATVGADTFTITTRTNVTVTVNVTSSTTYLDPAVTSPTFATIKVGDHVAVFGTDTSNTVAAAKVSIGGPGGFGHFGHAFGGTPPAAVGTVATVDAGTFTVTTHSNTTVTVDVTGTTTYLDSAGTSPTFADVKVGENVAVFGTDTSNTVAATKVAIRPIGGPDGPGGRHGFGGTPPAAVGTVASVGANTFTVTTTNNTTVTVTVTGSTTYQDPGVTSPSFTNVKAGDHVAVFGTDTNNTVAATQVWIGGSAVRPGPGGPGDPGGFGGPGGPGDGSPPAFGGTPMTGSSVGSTTSFGSAGSTLN